MPSDDLDEATVAVRAFVNAALEAGFDPPVLIAALCQTTANLAMLALARGRSTDDAEQGGPDSLIPDAGDH